MVDILLEKDLKKLGTNLLCVYAFQKARKVEKLESLDKALQTRIGDRLKTFGFQGNAGESLVLEGNAKFKRIVAIGLGTKKDFDKRSMRQAFFNAVKQANALKVDSLTVLVPGTEKSVQEAVEGIRYATYQFAGRYRKQDKALTNTLKTVHLVSLESGDQASAKRADIVMDAVDFTRNLVNLPSNIVTPSYLENEARSLAEAEHSSLSVLSKEDAQRHKMGAFLAVAQGSREPAKMIVLSYSGAPKTKKTYAVVGKGITFDSGGVSLKPPKGMSKMKTDMAGGAAALGVFKAVSQLELKINLLAIVPATENMPGGNAYRPGDILTASNGKTIEVISTDAEGRLVLADALVYAQKLGADRIVDIATLTGAVITTFGSVHTALMANDDTWAGKYLKAARTSGEKTWQLPMDKEYDDLIKSNVCDMVNAVENRQAGTVTGGKFLERFIKKRTQWIHLDIAGTSYLAYPKGYLEKQATGIPVRTIVEMLKSEIR
ncbi:MAG: leucyl aminopeptidase [Proteobacteria bacterium]|nr:leucyl aminopeptidase [Pseudomonadota bacterium]